MNLSEERPFFVVGSQRSGTTMLRYMLCANPRLYIPPESNFMPRFVSKSVHQPMSKSDAIRVVKTIREYRSFFKDWKGSIPDPAEFVDELPDRKLETIFNGIYSSYASQFNKPRWGDKTPSYVMFIDVLAELFPNAQFIHIIRDGRDAALSMMHTYIEPRFFYVDLFYTATVWKRRVEKAMADGARIGKERYFEVRYEELVRSPETNLRAISDFLGESYSPAMADSSQEAAKHFHSTGIHGKTRLPPSPTWIGSWQNEMSPSDQRLFLRIAGDLLARLGYPTNYPEKLTLMENLRYLRLKTKYSLVETGRRSVLKGGIFHPTALLTRER